VDDHVRRADNGEVLFGAMPKGRYFLVRAFWSFDGVQTASPGSWFAPGVSVAIAAL